MPQVPRYINNQMSIEVRPYNLPDAVIFNGAGDGLMIWQPSSLIIVLGQSNTPEKSLVIRQVEVDNVPVTKRPTGGETVILSPEMAVITVAREFENMPRSGNFFSEINSVIIDNLESLGVSSLVTRGISDIAIGNRKILGSSMHRKNNRLVYHAVLNLGGDTSLFNRYLLHPVREPGYRQGRNHSEFVTSLKEQGYNITIADLAPITRAISSYSAVV